MKETATQPQQIATIIQSVNLGGLYRVDITKSANSYNGLVYEGEGNRNLICCVAAGLNEGIERVAEKAKEKLKTKTPFFTLAEYCKFFKCTPEQVKKQYDANAAQLEKCRDKAKKSGKKYGGLDANGWQELIENFSNKRLI